MPSRQFVTFLAIGLAVVGIFLGVILYSTRGSHMELKGGIQKIRIQSMEETSTVVVVDFRFANPANYPFVVRTVDVQITDQKGQPHEGMAIAEMDAKRLFQYYPLLGPKYNDSLLTREKVPAHQSLDKMIAARFDMPEEQVKARKKLTVHVEDVDGAVSEFSQ